MNNIFRARRIRYSLRFLAALTLLAALYFASSVATHESGPGDVATYLSSQQRDPQMELFLTSGPTISCFCPFVIQRTATYAMPYSTPTAENDYFLWFFGLVYGLGGS